MDFIYNLFDNSLVIWGLLAGAGVALATGLSAPASKFIAGFGSAYLVGWYLGRRKLMKGQDLSHIDATFTYLIPTANGGQKLYNFDMFEDEKISKVFEFNKYLEIRLLWFALFAKVDEPVVHFKTPIMERNEGWISSKLSDMFERLKGTHVNGADGVDPTLIREINLYKGLYGPLVKRIKRNFMQWAMLHALNIPCEVVKLVIAVTWETYTPNKTRHWRIHVTLEQEHDDIMQLTLPTDDALYPLLRTIKLMIPDYRKDRADPSTPFKYGTVEIPVPTYLLANPERLASAISGIVTEGMPPAPPPNRVRQQKGRRIPTRS